MQTHPGHVLHEDGEGLLKVVPQTAVVLNDALVTQVLQQLDLALQSADLLRRRGATAARSCQTCIFDGAFKQRGKSPSLQKCIQSRRRGSSKEDPCVCVRERGHLRGWRTSEEQKPLHDKHLLQSGGVSTGRP